MKGCGDRRRKGNPRACSRLDKSERSWRRRNYAFACHRRRRIHGSGCDPLGRELLEAASPTSSAQVEGINEIVELQVLRGWAFVRNKVDVSVTTASGEAVHLSGCTLALFRQEADGRWRLARHANMLTTKKPEQGRLGGVV